MEEQGQDRSDLGQAFQELGAHLQALLKTAWESDERRRIQSEISEGLRQLEAALRETAAEVSESETGQRIKEDIGDLGERMRSGEFEAKARSELLKAVTSLNVELEKLRGRWEATESAARDSTDEAVD